MFYKKEKLNMKYSCNTENKDQNYLHKGMYLILAEF